MAGTIARECGQIGLSPAMTQKSPLVRFGRRGLRGRPALKPNPARSRAGLGDLRRLPQIERKQALLELLGQNGIDDLIVFSEHLTGDGQEMFEHSAYLGWEGIVSKNAQVPLRLFCRAVAVAYKLPGASG
jgi:hypothetical protein